MRNLINKIIKRIITLKPNKYGWFGHYYNWNDALTKSTGYNIDEIITKVKSATYKVINGEYAFERDSVLFNEIQYQWPLITALLWSKNCKENSLKVLDYGGSLGSIFFQTRQFLSDIELINWDIIEQKNYVIIGKEIHELINSLNFYTSLDEYKKKNISPNVLILSSILPFIESPFFLIKSLKKLKIPVIVVDRTFFSIKPYNWITIQKVDPIIYKASYPSWIFTDYYDVICEFKSIDGIFKTHDVYSEGLGFIFKLKKTD